MDYGRSFCDRFPEVVTCSSKEVQRRFQGNLRHGNVRKAKGCREAFRLLRRANALKGGNPIDGSSMKKGWQVPEEENR